MERFGLNCDDAFALAFCRQSCESDPLPTAETALNGRWSTSDFPFMCTLLAFQPVQAQLLFADANALTELDEAEHFLLYDRITQLQIWATRLRMKTDASRLALVTPVQSQQRFSLSKSKVFKAVDKVQSPVELKQRSLAYRDKQLAFEGLNRHRGTMAFNAEHKYNNMKLSLTTGV